MLPATSFSACPYLVLITATPSLVPAMLCNIGKFKNSLTIKMIWVFFFVAGPVDPVHRTWLLEQLCWYNRGSGRQATLWGQAGQLCGEKQQDSSEPGDMAGAEFTWRATALAHSHFPPGLFLHGSPWVLL